MSEKVRKGWKWASEYLKKHCLEQHSRHGRRMNASGAKKTNVFAKFCTWAPKTRFERFLPFWAQKERKSILGDFWLQKRAQMLMFSTVWRSGWKRWFFVKKLLFGEEKTIKSLFLAQHENMKSCQKMKKVIFTHFRQKRKTLYKRNVLGTLFRPESQKHEISTFGSKKVEMSSFFASGELLAPQTLQNGKVGPKVKKAVLGVLGSKNVPRTLCFPLFGARGGKDDFVKKMLFGEEKQSQGHNLRDIK